MALLLLFLRLGQPRDCPSTSGVQTACGSNSTMTVAGSPSYSSAGMTP
jgi:hypothetical protein